MRQVSRTLAVLLSAAVSVCPACAFQTPLSDESVREAYFLGQRHDGSFLTRYIKTVPAPKTGPHIASITFLTPFAQLVQFSNSYIGNYSAQQARLNHLNQKECVKISVEIYLTASYGALIPDPARSSAKSSTALIPRPYDFWKDFRVQVYGGSELLSPSVSGGRALYRCGRRGPCRPMGAAIEMEFPASAFTNDSAMVMVNPPEGDPVIVQFDLGTLR